MAKTKTKGLAAPKAQPDPKAMAISLENVDSMTQDICAKIATLAKLAAGDLRSREDGDRDFRLALGALDMIDYWASDLENCNNCEAENHGCNYISPDRRVAHG